MNEIHFLNIDLDIESSIDISPIIKEWGERICVFRNEEIDGIYYGSFETACSGIDEIIAEYVSLIDGLSKSSRDIWDKALRRDFDFGYESGPTAWRYTAEKIKELYHKRVFIVKLENVVPWGRTLEEYELMFSLSDKDKRKKILGCGDGPASFNMEIKKLGGSVVSVDPIYQFSKSQIITRIKEVRSLIMEQIYLNKNEYVWKNIKSPEMLESVRMSAMNAFLSDYDSGRLDSRYIYASLPNLPFQNNEFDLAVCSHFLFLYSEHFSESQHIESILELTRIAREVRIYPLLTLDGRESKHLPVV